jgi:hypothetical protein
MNWWGCVPGSTDHAFRAVRSHITTHIRGGTIQRMKATRLVFVALAAAVALAAPAQADPDSDFDNQLQTYGIYGPHDYNPYLAKIACRRLGDHVDPDAAASSRFLLHNLPRGTTQVQAYQFLGTAIGYYCPDLAPVMQNIPPAQA